ncbi:PRTRC system protein F [Rugamonas sp. A1-17]|nr:PRTRC system protein F [Rugamonas sp. A1-17]
MHTNITEINAVVASSANFVQPLSIPSLQSFAIPTLHACIPRAGFLPPQDSTITKECADLARLLIAAGIIDTASIPEHATTVHEVLEFGLMSWFNANVGNLKALEVRVEILRPRSMQALIENATDDDYYGEFDREVTGAFGIQFNGDSGWNPYTVSEAAMSTELVAPGLFKAAMAAIKDAASISVPIRTAEFALGDFQGQWENWGEVKLPCDDEVLETLRDRFEDEATAQEYLPSVLLPILGGDLCLTSLVPKKDRLTLKQLTGYAKSGADLDVRAIASQVLNLRHAIKVANREQARLPNLEGLNVNPIEPGCSLIYQFDQRVFAAFDDHYKSSMSDGTADEMFGLDDLPNDPLELKSYFERLSLALAVLNEMDILISMIAKPHYMQD